MFYPYDKVILDVLLYYMDGSRKILSVLSGYDKVILDVLLNYMDGPQIFGSVRSIDYSIVWMDHEIFEN